MVPQVRPVEVQCVWTHVDQGREPPLLGELREGDPARLVVYPLPTVLVGLDLGRVPIGLALLLERLTPLVPVRCPVADVPDLDLAPVPPGDARLNARHRRPPRCAPALPVVVPGRCPVGAWRSGDDSTGPQRHERLRASSRCRRRLRGFAESSATLREADPDRGTDWWPSHPQSHPGPTT